MGRQPFPWAGIGGCLGEWVGGWRQCSHPLCKLLAMRVLPGTPMLPDTSRSIRDALVSAYHNWVADDSHPQSPSRLVPVSLADVSLGFSEVELGGCVGRWFHDLAVRWSGGWQSAGVAAGR